MTAKLTMDDVRPVLAPVGFIEKAADPENQFFDKRVLAGSLGRFATDLKADWPCAFDDESLCIVDVVPAEGIAQLYVPDLDHVESFDYGSPDAVELIALAAAAPHAP